MNTQRTTELLKHFEIHGISHEPKKGLNEVLEYQDCIGHATISELRTFENDMDYAARKHFIWVNLHTLDHDMAMDIVHKTYITRAFEKIVNAEEESWTKRDLELAMKELALKTAKKHVYRKIARLQKRIAYFEELTPRKALTAARQRQKIDTLYQETLVNREKAHKWDRLQEILNS